MRKVDGNTRRPVTAPANRRPGGGRVDPVAPGGHRRRLSPVGPGSGLRLNPVEVGRWLFLLGALTFALVPILWVTSTAFSSAAGIATGGLIPRNPTLENFSHVFQQRSNPFLMWTWNSIKVATITAVASVFVTALSAYGFSRFRFLFRRSLLLGILLIQVFPSSLTMVALFLLIHQIGVYIPAIGLNSHAALILAYVGAQMGINVWLMKGFFDTVPSEIDESARVDGATHTQIFVRLIIPLVRPILVVVGIIVFMATFSEFVLARILLRGSENITLMVGLQIFIDEPTTAKWGIFAAGSFLASIPVVTLYLALQDTIVGGLTTGSVKG